MEQLELLEPPAAPVKKPAAQATEVVYYTGGKRAYQTVKRIFDIVLSLCALLLLWPVFAAAAVAIRLDSRGPVIYAQQRCGKNGKPFKMYKFRSMCPDAEQQLGRLLDLNEVEGPAFKITHDPRVTRVGRFLRRTSIDELPQLVNIIRGEMSIVGPRPPLPREVEMYTPYQHQRLSVTPGLTCYWQCLGRSNVSFDEWMELDLKYIRERSLWTDFTIVLRTVPAVLFAKGAC